MIQRIKKTVTHQGIGGKEFKVDEYVTKTLTPNEVSEKGIREGNPACWNFMDRREDFNLNFPHKLYYVKVDGLGYIIAEDEIETIVEASDVDLPHMDPDFNFPENGGAGGFGGAGALASATPVLKQEINPIAEELNKHMTLSNKELLKHIGENMSKGFMNGGMN